MAIQYTGLGYYTMAADASMNFSGDFSLGFWGRVDDNAGTAFQYFLSNGTVGAANTLNIFLVEDSYSSAGIRGKWLVRYENATEIQSSSSPGGDGKDRLIVISRTGGVISLYFCDFGGTATLEGTTTTASDNDGAAAWNIGRRTDGDANRYYDGVAWSFFKCDVALSIDEITALGSGLSIFDLGIQPAMYQPMESAETTLKDIAGSNDATKVSTPTTVEQIPVGVHNPIYVYVEPTLAAFKPFWIRGREQAIGYIQ